MRLRVTNQIVITSDEPMGASHLEARMTPCWTDNRSLLNPTVTIEPSEWRTEYFDYWGTAVIAFNVSESHRRLAVTAATELDFAAPAGQAGMGLGFDEMNEPTLLDHQAEYLLDDAPAEVPDAVRSLRSEAASIADFVHGLAGTGALGESDDQIVGRALSLIRWAGVPARFVAGYLIPAELQIGVREAASSHGWLQYWDGRWCGWDPRLDCAPDSRHVVIGYAPTRSDIPVLVGTHRAGEDAAANCEVRVERLS